MNKNFSYFLLKQVYLPLSKSFHNSSCNLKNHYETLKVQRSCSQKEIRDSFIKLSKEHHPDVNKSPEAHKEFLKVQEAYNILCKPESRANYDLGLTNPGSGVIYESTNSYYPFGTKYNAYQRRHGANPWDDPSFYYNRDKSKDDLNRPYYGIKGLKKQSNGRVALFIVLIASIAFSIQMVIIRHTLMKQQFIMNEKSKEAQKVLNEIKNRVNKTGNEAQIEIHRRQFEELDRIKAAKATE
ncbi:uncharacterized protein [Euwallacea fornicatus]|uniref:uncharacterized protein n=1 Tax=Euwallacea fornicatus TaxID=995702 RepID=UPI0033905127